MKNACFTRVGGNYKIGQKVKRCLILGVLPENMYTLKINRRKNPLCFTSVIQAGKLIIPIISLILPINVYLSAQTMVIDEFFGGGGNNGAPTTVILLY